MCGYGAFPFHPRAHLSGTEGRAQSPEGQSDQGEASFTRFSGRSPCAVTNTSWSSTLLLGQTRVSGECGCWLDRH